MPCPQDAEDKGGEKDGRRMQGGVHRQVGEAEDEAGCRIGKGKRPPAAGKALFQPGLQARPEEDFLGQSQGGDAPERRRRRLRWKEKSGKPGDQGGGNPGV